MADTLCIDMNPTEQQIQQTIINFLKYKGYYVQRMNTGVIRSTYKGRDRMIRMSATGTPDIMAFKQVKQLMEKHENYEIVKLEPGVNLLFIEVKRPGNKPTPAQTMMMEELTAYGARCIVATCIEDVEKHL